MELTPAQFAVIKAYILSQNQQTAGKYAAILAALICFSSIIHFTGVAYHELAFKGTILRVLVAFPRTVERICLRRVIGFRSIGHAAMLLLFLGINLALTFTNMKFSRPWAFLALRCGWMSVINLALTVFLALKNTPLAFMLGLSHEKLNILHRWTGRATFLYLIVHVFLFIASLYVQNRLSLLRITGQIHGEIAFGCMGLLVLSSVSSFRSRYYELFYKLHVILFILIIINVGLHQPELSTRVVPISATTGVLLCLDRAYRTMRMLYYSRGNKVILSAMADGATKIIFERHITSKPGSHAFIWIPAIRRFETHPFTISSPFQTSFVVRKQKGFTADLHQYALLNPSVRLRAFFDGPYGAVPNFRNHETVVLFAGGSGASFTFAIAIDLISQVAPVKTRAIEFIWAIRDKSQMLWFENQLQQLRASPLVLVTIHLTNQEAATGEVAQTKSLEAGLGEPNIIEGITRAGGGSAGVPLGNNESDIKAIASDSLDSASVDLQDGRPSIHAVISRAVSGVSSEESVGVGACGPKGMIGDTRNAVSSLKRVGGPRLMLHTEQFGY